jgi:hypothetical protein
MFKRRSTRKETVMADKSAELFGIFQRPAAPAILQGLADATQTIMRAQLDYTQAIMRAQAALFGVWLPSPAAAADEDERPSVAAARRKEYAAP